MRRFIEGQSREQVTLLPECLDDFVGADNPVRIVDAFVEELDLLASQKQPDVTISALLCVPQGMT
jgi:transposase